MSRALLEVKNLQKHFPVRGGILRRPVATVHAVDDVSFSIEAGQTLGLVGESGCGKSTVGKTLLQLLKHYNGEVWFDGKPLHNMPAAELKAIRREVQIIFQDPMESLNPRHTVAQIIEEPLLIHGIGNARSRQQAIIALAERVGLSKDVLQRYPHEFSGGQRQRIGIARAIALKPRLIVCDEPVSALDVSIQSQILNLLLELQQELNCALLFISHDLAVVKHISHRIAVMYLGQLVEVADAEVLYQQARHPYTQSLINAIPQPDPSSKVPRRILAGEPPSPLDPPSACRFHPRCPRARDKCSQQAPAWESAADGHELTCHFWNELE